MRVEGLEIRAWITTGSLPPLTFKHHRFRWTLGTFAGPWIERVWGLGCRN